MKVTVTLCGLLALLLMAPLGPAQQPHAPDLEARIRALELKAARAERLELEVTRLKDALHAKDLEVESRELESSVTALLEKDHSLLEVTSRRATGLVLGGQLRLQSEYRLVSSYGAPDPRGTDEDFTAQRTRLNFDARIDDTIRVFVEIQDSRTWGEELSVLGDTEGVDLHQGYVDFETALGTPLTLRAGRFGLSLWNQRLLSDLDWSSVGRAFDGVLLFGKLGGWSVMGGYQVLAEDPIIDSDQDDDFYWASATYEDLADHKIGAAFFWLHQDAIARDASFGTFTLHFEGKGGGFDYSADGAFQFGEVGTADLEAFAGAVTAGYTFDAEWAPRIGVEWTYATGNDASTGKVETFNPLFPFGHAYQGYLDVFAWKNGHDFVLHLSAKPAEEWWVGLAVHAFFLDERDDAWYGGNGLPIRTFAGGSDEVGYELDLHAKVKIRKDVRLWFGYSHFFAGRFVEQSGASPDTDWAFVQLTVDF